MHYKSSLWLHNLTGSGSYLILLPQHISPSPSHLRPDSTSFISEPYTEAWLSIRCLVYYSFFLESSFSCYLHGWSFWSLLWLKWPLLRAAYPDFPLCSNNKVTVTTKLSYFHRKFPFPLSQTTILLLLLSPQTTLFSFSLILCPFFLFLRETRSSGKKMTSSSYHKISHLILLCTHPLPYFYCGWTLSTHIQVKPCCCEMHLTLLCLFRTLFIHLSCLRSVVPS